MASKTLVPVEDYLKSSFDGPEPDYLDGEIVERHLGSRKHSRGQKRLLRFLEALEESSSLVAYPEITLKLSPTRYRVADIALVVDDAPDEDYPTQPPVVVVEIVSKDDRHVEIQRKLAEYHAWGVKHIWSLDPWMRKLFVYDNTGYHEVPAYELPEFGARLTAAEIFGVQTPQQ